MLRRPNHHRADRQDFLKHTHSGKLYLAGDSIDGWALQRNWYWPREHNNIAQKIRRNARKGTQVLFIPDIHDAFAPCIYSAHKPLEV